ncbi:hypothetical protein ScPMuIL_009146 [Solemya velum]
MPSLKTNTFSRWLQRSTDKAGSGTIGPNFLSDYAMGPSSRKENLHGDKVFPKLLMTYNRWLHIPNNKLELIVDTAALFNISLSMIDDVCDETKPGRDRCVVR